jgi:hypothetical protein
MWMNNRKLIDFFDSQMKLWSFFGWLFVQFLMNIGFEWKRICEFSIFPWKYTKKASQIQIFRIFGRFVDFILNFKIYREKSKAFVEENKLSKSSLYLRFLTLTFSLIFYERERERNWAFKSSLSFSLFMLILWGRERKRKLFWKLIPFYKSFLTSLVN